MPKNPRRDIIEYGVLLTLTTGVTAAAGLIAFMNFTDFESFQKQRVDLSAPVDFKGAWRELQRLGKGQPNAKNDQSSGNNDPPRTNQ